MLKSLSLRLLLIFVLGFILLIALLRFGVGHSLKQEINTFHAHSALRMTRIILDRESGVNWNRAERVAERTRMNLQIQTADRSWASNGEVVDFASSQFKPISLEKLHRHHKRHRPEIALAFYKGKRTYRVSTPKATLYYTIEHYKGRFGGHLLLLAAIFLLGLYAAIRYLFSPVADIKRVVKEIGEGNFTAKTNVHRNDELGELAKQVDLMRDQLAQLIESKRSMLLGISHELRTPITRAKVSSELLPAGKHRDAIAADMQEMESIITELLEAERLSENTSLSRQVVSINQLVNDMLKESFSQEDVDFQPLTDDPFLNIDPIRVKLLLKNLVSNALQYTPVDKPKPQIRLNLSMQQLQICVTDFGMGIESEALSRLTEPFYRPDPSRQRKTGGFGLGLYLCHVIAQAHNGSLKISSELTKGTKVTALLSLV